jgi:hypothetical protein
MLQRMSPNLAHGCRLSGERGRPNILQLRSLFAARETGKFDPFLTLHRITAQVSSGNGFDRVVICLRSNAPWAFSIRV